MKNPFVALAAMMAAAMSQINAEVIKQSAKNGIHQSRSRNRGTPRSRIPGAHQPAGAKLSRMAAESRIGKRS